MSTVAPAVDPVAPARTSGLAAIFEHTRYVLGENRVTAFAFALLLVIIAGGAVRPLSRSPRSAGIGHRRGAEAAVRGALVRHRSARPRYLQPRHRRDPARHLHRGRLRRAGVFDGRARRHRRRLFRRLDRPHRRAHRRHHHGVSAVRAGDGHRRSTRQHRAEHHHRDCDRELPALRARRPRRGQCAPQRRLRAGGAAVGQWRVPDSARCISCPTSCRS